MQISKKFKSCRVHTTIGIYANGDYVVNGVKDEHLEEHIKYNVSMRPGRTLLVNGEVVHKGNGFEELDDIIEECSEISESEASLEYA